MGNKRYGSWILLLITAFMVMAGGCGGEGSDGHASLDDAKLTVSPLILSLVAGATDTLTAQNYTGEVTWESENSGVVTAEKTGTATALVTAVAMGTANITVIDGSGEKAICTVEVMDEVVATPSKWIDIADTSWYIPGKTEFEISKPAHLAGVAKLVSETKTDALRDDFSGKTIRLTDDIVLDGAEWTPIGGSQFHAFKGTFDGSGRTIQGVKIKNEFFFYVGLFGHIDTGAVVKNIHLVNADVSIVSNGFPDYDLFLYAGGIAGLNGGTIEGCTSSNGNISSSCADYSYAGGIVGYSDGSIKGCTSSGNISSSTSAPTSSLCHLKPYK
jgi:hypothetical protein